MTTPRPSRREPDPGSVRTLPRPAHLRRSPTVFRVGMGLFGIGSATMLVMIVLFASGERSFPFWTWLLAALAPVGLLVGALRVRRAGTSL